MKKTQSLAFVVSLWTAVAIAASMAVYAVFQYFTIPGMTVKELVLTHLWHVVVLGAIIYFFCWLLLRQVLLQPLTKIYLHLYGVGSGRVQALEVDTRVTELHSIVEGINLMLRVQRADASAEDNALEHARRDVQEIKNLIGKLPEAGTHLHQRVADLEQNLTAAAMLRADPARSADVKKNTQPLSPAPRAQAQPKRSVA